MPSMKGPLRTLAWTLPPTVAAVVMAYGAFRWADPGVWDSGAEVSVAVRDDIVNRRRSSLRQLLRDHPQAVCPDNPATLSASTQVVVRAMDLRQGTNETPPTVALVGLAGVPTRAILPDEPAWHPGAEAWPAPTFIDSTETPGWVVAGTAHRENGLLYLTPVTAIEYSGGPDAYPVLCETRTAAPVPAPDS